MLDTITHRLDSVTQRLDSVSNELSSLIHEVHQTLPTAVDSIPASDSFVRTTYIPTIVRLGLDKWDILAFIIALVSLYYACKAYRSQKETERNTMKITEESQFMLIAEYFNYFFSNLIVIKAIAFKLNEKFDTHYVSQELIRKLSINIESLHPEAFLHNKEKYSIIHRLFLQIRNFNIETETAELHICDRYVPAHIKTKDLSTLLFKQVHLCQYVIRAIEQLSSPKSESQKKYSKKQQANYEMFVKKAKDYIEERASYIFRKSPYDDKVDLEKIIKDHHDKVIDYLSEQEKEYLETIASKLEIDSSTFISALNICIDHTLRSKNSHGHDIIALIEFFQKPK